MLYDLLFFVLFCRENKPFFAYKNFYMMQFWVLGDIGLAHWVLILKKWELTWDNSAVLGLGSQNQGDVTTALPELKVVKIDLATS